jgi:hypothetical protein
MLIALGYANRMLLIILGKARLQEDWHSQSQPGNKHKTLSYAYCLGLCQSYAYAYCQAGIGSRAYNIQLVEY